MFSLRNLFRNPARSAPKPRRTVLGLETLEARANPAPIGTLQWNAFTLSDYNSAEQFSRQSHVYFDSPTARPDLQPQDIYPLTGIDRFRFIKGGDVYQLSGKLQ